MFSVKEVRLASRRGNRKSGPRRRLSNPRVIPDPRSSHPPPKHRASPGNQFLQDHVWPTRARPVISFSIGSHMQSTYEAANSILLPRSVNFNFPPSQHLNQYLSPATLTPLSPRPNRANVTSLQPDLDSQVCCTHPLSPNVNRARKPRFQISPSKSGLNYVITSHFKTSPQPGKT